MFSTMVAICCGVAGFGSKVRWRTVGCSTLHGESGISGRRPVLALRMMVDSSE